MKITSIEQSKTLIEISPIKKIDTSNKVESKFRVGDFIVDNCGYVWKIEGILNQLYLLEGVEGGESRPTIECVNKTFHLWTIKDAKDGDVLVASNGSLFILAKAKDNSAYYYFSLWENGSKEISDGNHSWENTKDCHPATKEQRDLLFQKMKEAGYEWDAERKELKKIEQKKENNMTQEELVKFLKENLRIEVNSIEDWETKELCIRLCLGDETLSCEYVIV